MNAASYRDRGWVCKSVCEKKCRQNLFDELWNFSIGNFSHSLYLTSLFLFCLFSLYSSLSLSLIYLFLSISLFCFSLFSCCGCFLGGIVPGGGLFLVATVSGCQWMFQSVGPFETSYPFGPFPDDYEWLIHTYGLVFNRKEVTMSVGEQ